MTQPLLHVIIEKLREVLNNSLTREEVADWAMRFIEDDEADIKDFHAWELLKQVGAIDMIESPDNYLYSDDDIKKWITDFSK